MRFRLQGRYLLWRGFPSTSANAQLCNSPTRRQTDEDEPYNPYTTTTAVYHVAWVWADPFSLATTQGVEVSFLSSGYLDVSVPQVSFSHPMNSGADTLAGGFPHSEILGSKLVCQLPGAYRRLRRPSSPDIAKASTVCAYSLDHITPKRRATWMLVDSANATYPD